jgi:hypothetical protein
MALIKSFRDVPPGGWKYVQPETAVSFTSDNYEDLIRQIIPHRKYKNIPFESVHLDVQRQLCSGLSTDWCHTETDEVYRPVKDLTARMTTSMAVSVGKAVVAALAEVAAGKSALVPVEEAQRRAAICRGCPFNKASSLCSCSAVYKAIEATIPKDRRQPGISVCMACGCSLQAKVNLQLDVVLASNQPETVFPAHCWQLPADPLREVSGKDTTK